jgi:putative DNA methylase
MSPEFRPPNRSSDDQVYPVDQEKNGSWYSRGYLPHFGRSHLSQAITFRLAGCLPKQKLRKIKRSTRFLEEEKRNAERHKQIEQYLDSGHGRTWLKELSIGRLVHRSMLYHDEQRYLLHAWVVMPNHVHILMTPEENASLSDIVHSLKSYTAKKINDQKSRSGSVWQRGYYDRYIRNNDHFWSVMRYIELNPVKADLCSQPLEWEWGSAGYRKKKGIQVMDYDME